MFDWTAWEKYRATVAHPSGAFKPADIVRARENLTRYTWAKTYAAGLEKTAQARRQLPPLTNGRGKPVKMPTRKAVRA